MNLLQTGAKIDAEEALSKGLISAIVEEKENLHQDCLDRIRHLSGKHPHLVKYHRRQMLPSSQEMQTALESYYSDMAKSIFKIRNSQ